MTTLRLQVNAAASADWLAELSAALPETRYNVSATIPVDGGLLGIVEVQQQDSETLVGYLEEVPAVDSFEVLHEDDQMVVFQFKSQMTESYGVLVASETVPQYPVALEDGWYSAQLTASQERLSEYLDELAAVGIPYEIESMTHSHELGEMLTERQLQVITEAVERGYYETSRRCTLVELAASFDVNKSSMSKLLQRAENRIVTEFVAEASS